ncbi:MAG: autotransporter outer membrane beta-barrel domain-containing protein, partial [Opitutales bacterium]|nr:autotransporter outer membrane beta-barrel domain-containing protein [Opitutales bacterium]
NKNIEGTSMVSVRNMNRVASYGSDSNASGSDNYVFGGLVNVDYIVNEDLFFGAGVGGFESKSSGRGVAGDADAESVVLNAYGDYAFAENFDWYFGATYSFNMNEAERTDSAGGIAKQDWDSHTIGMFTGVRYTWKPLENQEFYVKPLVGVNANFVLGEDSTSRGAGAADTISTDIGDYTSFKSVVGVELTYDFSNGFYLAGRMLYTHEFADDSYDFNASMMGVNTANGTFRVRGNEVDRDAGILSIGAGYSFNENWSAYLDYAAEITSDVFHNINAGIQYKF